MTNDLPPQYPAAAPAAPVNPSDERLWMTLVDVGGIFFSFIPSLIAYLLLKDRSDFVRRNAVSALNFQITFGIVQLANAIVGAVLTPLTLGIWLVVQSLIALAAGVIVLVFSILAAMAANRGVDYEYRLALRLVR